MVARLLDIWNAARAERSTWPLPWTDGYEEAMAAVSTDRHNDAVRVLAVLSGAWSRHLLRQVGVRDGDLPPPTSSQQRKLVRLLNQHGQSQDRGLTLLVVWSKWLFMGKTDHLLHDFERLAGDMDIEILASVINHVRRTSPQFNGEDITLKVEVDDPRVCSMCGVELTRPRDERPYDDDAPTSTDCGGNCLACQRRVETMMGGDETDG